LNLNLLLNLNAIHQNIATNIIKNAINDGDLLKITNNIYV